ncbi:hypothetical protein AAGV37_24705 [Pseudomonas protegens]|uniref:hypothetical protein n=1 Tax=Pseudomonas protegens TaxID=380021 RepID=UPI003158109A
MSNEMTIPRDLAVDLLDGLRITQERARKELLALLAKPADQGRGETVPKHKFDTLVQHCKRLESDIAQARAEVNEITLYQQNAVWFWQHDGEDFLESLSCPIIIQPHHLRGLLQGKAQHNPIAEQPAGTASDKYKAELYDEVWLLAQGMGFGNVTDALMKLQSQLQGEPPSYKPGLYAVRHIDNWDGERDVALTFANLDADGKWTDSGTGDALLAYRGDKILRAWPLDCSDAPGAQIIGVPRNWLEDWALELVEAAQDGGQMSNQVEHLLQLYPKQ